MYCRKEPFYSLLFVLMMDDIMIVRRPASLDDVSTNKIQFYDPPVRKDALDLIRRTMYTLYAIILSYLEK